MKHFHSRVKLLFERLLTLQQSFIIMYTIKCKNILLGSILNVKYVWREYLLTGMKDVQCSIDITYTKKIKHM